MNKYSYAFCVELNRFVSTFELRELINVQRKKLNSQCPERKCGVQLIVKNIYTFLIFFSCPPKVKHQSKFIYLKNCDRRRKEYQKLIKKKISLLIKIVIKYFYFKNEKILLYVKFIKYLIYF